MIVVISRGDGGVSIMNVQPGEDADRAVAHWRMAAPEGYVSHATAQARDIPADRTFRNAWKPDLTTDMARARGIWRDRIRAARQPRLAALDIAALRAIEEKNDPRLAEIIIEKQALRDATNDPAIDAASTPEELRAAWPVILR